MIKKILVPFDGSTSARNALGFALSTGEKTSASVQGIFVEDQRHLLSSSVLGSIASAAGLTPTSEQPLAPAEMLEAVEAADALASSLSAEFSDLSKESSINTSFLNQFGLPTEEIQKLARSVDFIALGIRGKNSKLVSAKPGGVLHALLSEAVSPIAVVPDMVQPGPEFVLAYDGTVAAERALRFSAHFAETLGIKKFHLLHVNDTGKDEIGACDSAKLYLSQFPFQTAIKVLSGEPGETIRQYTMEVNASVLVMGNAHHNAVRETLFGSTLRKVLEQPPTTVLCVS